MRRSNGLKRPSDDTERLRRHTRIAAGIIVGGLGLFVVGEIGTIIILRYAGLALVVAGAVWFWWLFTTPGLATGRHRPSRKRNR